MCVLIVLSGYCFIIFSSTLILATCSSKNVKNLGFVHFLHSHMPHHISVSYVINLSPTIALHNDVYNRLWYGNDISYDHLHVLSCKHFLHIPKEDRSKLNVKSNHCVFIGYDQDEFTNVVT